MDGLRRALARSGLSDWATTKPRSAAITAWIEMGVLGDKGNRNALEAWPLPYRRLAPSGRRPIMRALRRGCSRIKSSKCAREAITARSRALTVSASSDLTLMGAASGVGWPYHERITWISYHAQGW